MQEPSLFDTPEEIVRREEIEKARKLDEQLQKIATSYTADRKDIASIKALKLVLQFNEANPKEKIDVAAYQLLEPKIEKKIDFAKELYENESRRRRLPKQSFTGVSPSAKHFQDRKDIFD